MDEPEAAPAARGSGERTGPPQKKPLAEFLAEFEERLRSHPDQPATGALLALDDRAAGARRSTVESTPERPPRLPRPRPWRTEADAPTPPEAVAPPPAEVRPAPPAEDEERETAPQATISAPAEVVPPTTPPDAARGPVQKHHRRRRRRHR